MLAVHRHAPKDGCAVFQISYPHCKRCAPTTVHVKTSIDNWHRFTPCFRQDRHPWTPYTCEVQCPIDGKTVEYKFVLDLGLDSERWVISPDAPSCVCDDGCENNIFTAEMTEFPTPHLSPEPYTDDPLWAAGELFDDTIRCRRKVPFSYEQHRIGKILLFGSWDNWRDPYVMTKRSAHECYCELMLPPGSHEFKFYDADAKKWCLNRHFPTHTQNGVTNHCVHVTLSEGGYQRRIPTPMGRKARMHIRTETPTADVAALFGGEEQRIPVVFAYPFHAHDVKLVTSADGFEEQYQMTHDEDGTFSRTLYLLPGQLEYKFIVNGSEWVCDPTAPICKDGPHFNNAMTVRPTGTTLAAGIGL